MNSSRIHAILFTGTDTQPATLVHGSDCEVSAYVDRGMADILCKDLIHHRGDHFRVVSFDRAREPMTDAQIRKMIFAVLTVADYDLAKSLGRDSEDPEESKRTVREMVRVVRDHLSAAGEQGRGGGNG